MYDSLFYVVVMNSSTSLLIIINFEVDCSYLVDNKPYNYFNAELTGNG